MPADANETTGRITMGADSGFYSRAVVRAAKATGALFSITVRANPAIGPRSPALPTPSSCGWWSAGSGPPPAPQLARDVVCDYHAFITDRTGELLEIESDHRRHAAIEKVIEDLKDRPG